MGNQRRHAGTSTTADAALYPVIGSSGGRQALLVDGVVQSVAAADAAAGYWQAMVPDRAPRNALLLGLGGGTIAHLLVQRFGPLPVTGVEESTAVIAAAAAFDLRNLPLRTVHADALEFVHVSDEQFDYVAVDLYRGNRLVRGVLALPFLRTLSARLAQGGTVAYNLFNDDLLAGRLARLERVFDRIRLVEVGANAVFHGRPHRR